MRVIAVLSLVLSISALANGQPRPVAPEPIPSAEPIPETDDGVARTRSTTQWYGWQIILSDVVSTVALGSAVFSDVNGAFPTIGAVGYILGPQVIHAANGNGRTALGALALRIGLPFAGGVIGILTACDSGTDDCIASRGGRLLVGAGLGMVIAAVVDWTWSSRSVELPGTIAVGHCRGPTPCSTVGFAIRW